MSVLEKRIKIIDELLNGIKYDYVELLTILDDNDIFDNPQKRRIVNSFLFSFSKLQDNIGAKLFKEVLYELKEIEFKHIPMLDILYKLQQLNMLENVEEWEMLREIRNDLAHEYPIEFENRKENLKKAIWGYNELNKIYTKIKNYLLDKNIIKEEK